MSNTKFSNECNLELSTQSKIASDYQVNYLSYKYALINIENNIKKIDDLISDLNNKINNKKLEKQINYTSNCLPTNTDNSCMTECNNVYNPNNKDPQVIGKLFACQNTEKFNILDTIGTSINNLNTIIQDSAQSLPILNKCECSIPNYDELDQLNQELENLNLQKAQLQEQYDQINIPPRPPILNLTCCSNKIICENGSCGSLFDDCLVKESFKANIVNDDDNFFSSSNIISFILLIILILFILLQRK